MGRRIAYRLGRQQSFDKALGRIPWLQIRNRTLFPPLSPVLFLGHFQILPIHCRAVNAKERFQCHEKAPQLFRCGASFALTVWPVLSRRTVSIDSLPYTPEELKALPPAGRQGPVRWLRRARDSVQDWTLDALQPVAAALKPNQNTKMRRFVPRQIRPRHID